MRADHGGVAYQDEETAQGSGKPAGSVDQSHERTAPGGHSNPPEQLGAWRH
jgi:hypothetical protein